MTNAEHDKDMIESIEMWLHEIEPKWVEKELAWLEELRTRLLEEKSEIPKDLEEAANKFAVFYDQGTCDGIAQDCFKAGAKWQADHTPLPEDTVLFNKGVEEGKRLMMEEAVEGVVCYGSKGVYIETDFLGEYDTDVYGNPGDKVRVIVIPNTDEK